MHFNASNPHGIQERRTNMQRVGVWALGLGLVIIVGLLTTEQGYAEEKEHAPTCTLATLKGRYLFGGIATLGGQPLVVAGYHIFNGDGTGIDVVTSRINDILVDENSVHEISYTVNPDCSGTYTVLSVPLSF